MFNCPNDILWQNTCREKKYRPARYTDRAREFPKKLGDIILLSQLRDIFLHIKMRKRGNEEYISQQSKPAKTIIFEQDKLTKKDLTMMLFDVCCQLNAKKYFKFMKSEKLLQNSQRSSSFEDLIFSDFFGL